MNKTVFCQNCGCELSYDRQYQKPADNGMWLVCPQCGHWSGTIDAEQTTKCFRHYGKKKELIQLIESGADGGHGEFDKFLPECLIKRSEKYDNTFFPEVHNGKVYWRWIH